jgi:hypothetical protein
LANLIYQPAASRVPLLRSGEVLNAQFALPQKNTVPLAILHLGHFWKKMDTSAEIWAKNQLPERSLGCMKNTRGGVAKW